MKLLIAALLLTSLFITGCKKEENKELQKALDETSLGLMIMNYSAAMYAAPMKDEMDFSKLVPEHRQKAFNGFVNKLMNSLDDIKAAGKTKAEQEEKIKEFIETFVKENDKDLFNFINDFKKQASSGCQDKKEKEELVKCIGELISNDANTAKLEKFRFFDPQEFKKAMDKRLIQQGQDVFQKSK